MEQIIRIGMDTSKHVFQLHGVNAAEVPVLRKKLRRKEMVAFFAKLAPTVIAIEACGASHHWEHFSDHPLAVGNHMISDRSDFATRRTARTTVGGFAGFSARTVLALSAYATEMGRSSVLAELLDGRPLRPGLRRRSAARPAWRRIAGRWRRGFRRAARRRARPGPANDGRRGRRHGQACRFESRRWSRRTPFSSVEKGYEETGVARVVQRYRFHARSGAQLAAPSCRPIAAGQGHAQLSPQR